VWWVHAHGRHARRHPRHAVRRAIGRVVARHGRLSVGHHSPGISWRRTHRVAVPSTAPLAMPMLSVLLLRVVWVVRGVLRGLSGVLAKVASIAAGGPLGEGIGAVGRKGILVLLLVAVVLVVRAVEAVGHELASRRGGAAAVRVLEAGVRHDARDIAVGRALRDVAPARARVVRRNRCSAS
jgi:hypothetical protein